MTTFEGIVTLDTNRVAVTIGLEPDRVTLVVGDREVGEWAITDCVITDVGDGTWLIEAEEHALPFLPNDPGAFAQSLHGGPASEEASSPVAEPARPEKTSGSEFTIMEGPPPSALTRVGFYALCALTAGLGAWALATLLA